jgi:hypothetical protein
MGERLTEPRALSPANQILAGPALLTSFGLVG